VVGKQKSVRRILRCDPRVAARQTVRCACKHEARVQRGHVVERLRAPRARPSRKETVASLTRAVADRRRNRCASLARYLYGRRARVGPQAKACGKLTRRKAFWVVLSVSFTGGVRGGPGQAGKRHRLGGPPRESEDRRNESCRSAGADNRRCPRGDIGRQRSERVSVKAPPAVKGAGGQESAVPEERTKGALASNAENASPRQRGNPVVIRGTDPSESSRPKLA